LGVWGLGVMRGWEHRATSSAERRNASRTKPHPQDIRRIVRNDSRIVNKLHRRIFLDKITHDDVKIYLSFYVEASNRCALGSHWGHIVWVLQLF